MPNLPLGYGKLDLRYNNYYSKMLREKNHECFMYDNFFGGYTFYEEDFEIKFKMYLDYLDEKGYKYFEEMEKPKFKKYVKKYSLEHS